MISAEDPDNRKLWLAIRQALLIVLGAIEDLLGLKRSVIPKHEKKKDVR